jgi:hypothetical protein
MSINKAWVGLAPLGEIFRQIHHRPGLASRACSYSSFSLTRNSMARWA